MNRAQEWIHAGLGVPIEEDVSRSFERYLMELPWAGASIDWRKLAPRTRVNYVQAEKLELLCWLRGTSVAKFSHLAVWYSEKEGGVILPASTAILCLDDIYWNHQGARYSFGAEEVGEGFRFHFSDIVQFGPAEHLVAFVETGDSP